MLKKSLFLFLALALLLGGFMVPTGAARAARPEPPAAEGIQAPPAIDFNNLPDTLQKASQLQNSLTPDQLTAVRAILDKYSAEATAIHEVMAALGKPQRSEPAQMDAAIVERMNNLIANIEAEMAGVLGADQFALYQAVTRPSMPGTEMNPTSASTQGGYTSYCWYATYENTIAWYYNYYAYIYGYYDYYYTGHSYAYYAYVYAYYGWVRAGYALDYSAPLYMMSYYLGMWWTNDPYYSYYYNYYSFYYMDYAEYYAYYNYYYYGTTYGYYAYVYAYYGYYESYYAYYDAYYCYYYCNN